MCRTDLHLVDGELPNPTIPVVAGHEIVGRIEAVGSEVTTLVPGTRIVSVARLVLRRLRLLRADREDLCPNARYTGYQLNGGYAEYAAADASFLLSASGQLDDSCRDAPVRWADWLPRLSDGGAGGEVGIYGFGAAAHIIAQVAVHEGRELFAFAAPGDLRP